MNKETYAAYRARLDVAAALMDQYARGEYNTDEHPEIGSVVAGLADAMGLAPDDWDAGAYGHKFAMLAEWPRVAGGSNGD